MLLKDLQNVQKFQRAQEGQKVQRDLDQEVNSEEPVLGLLLPHVKLPTTFPDYSIHFQIQEKTSLLESSVHCFDLDNSVRSAIFFRKTVNYCKKNAST